MRRLRAALAPPQLEAATETVHHVRHSVAAELVHASLFGSRARGEARPDSDVDLLLVFRDLPPDREPFAGQAEEIAAAVARARGVPVTVWSVSLPDLERGRRTPMLVDALHDAIPLWPRSEPPRVPFTDADALYCAATLLLRVEEGGVEVAAACAAGDAWRAAGRLRDDLVRLCTANLLLDGDTRPRFAEAVREYGRRAGPSAELPEWLAAWAIASYGVGGKDEHADVARPPRGLGPACRALDRLHRHTLRRVERAGRPAPSLRNRVTQG